MDKDMDKTEEILAWAKTLMGADHAAEIQRLALQPYRDDETVVERDARIAVHAIALAAERDALRDTVVDLLYQFAYTGTKDGVPALDTGGLSALEGAFDILGWDDPHLIPEQACEEPGCPRRATCGVPTATGYKRLCGDHARTVERM